MLSYKNKLVVVAVFAVVLLSSLIFVGCTKNRKPPAWVNSNSLPGHKFSQKSETRKCRNASVIYLGSSEQTSKANFGPKEINFDFTSLK